jgi:hypothetical protein
MPFDTNQGMRSPNMGSGLIQSAAEILQLRPYWEQEYMNGQTMQQFSDWIKDPTVKQRYQNVGKAMPAQGQQGY